MAGSCFGFGSGLGPGLGLGLGLLGNEQVQVHRSMAVPNYAQILCTVCQRLIGEVEFGFRYRGLEPLGQLHLNLCYH